VLISHNDYMPSFVHITDAKKADVKVARLLDLQPGSIVAMDRAYIDYKMFSRWSDRDIFFVTRLKKNTLAFGATTIFSIYKDRWQIELFFKALKQNR
jgi:IS4 transposase